MNYFPPIISTSSIPPLASPRTTQPSYILSPRNSTPGRSTISEIYKQQIELPPTCDFQPKSEWETSTKQKKIEQIEKLFHLMDSKQQTVRHKQTYEHKHKQTHKNKHTSGLWKKELIKIPFKSFPSYPKTKEI